MTTPSSVPAQGGQQPDEEITEAMLRAADAAFKARDGHAARVVYAGIYRAMRAAAAPAAPLTEDEVYTIADSDACKRRANSFFPPAFDEVRAVRAFIDSQPSAPRAEAVAWQFRFVFADGKRGPWHCPLAGARPMNTGDPACNGATYEVRDLIPAAIAQGADEGERGSPC